MKRRFKIFFLEPNHAIIERPGFDEFMEPLNLCYIASAAKEADHEVIVKQQFNKNVDEIVNEIILYNADILALTFVTCFFNNAKEIIEKVKQKQKNLITIAGGSHTTGDPEESARYFDYVVVGEGETPFLNLLTELPSNKAPDIPSIGYYSDGKFILNKTQIRDTIFKGLPYRDSLDMTLYTGIGNGPPPMPKVGFASMLLSKGCRFSCDFCINRLVWKDSEEKNIKVVKRNPDDVVHEMEILQTNYNIGYVWFHDPDFPLYDHEYMQRFFIAKKKVPLLKYAFMTRIENILSNYTETEAIHFLSQLKDSGCHMIGFGIESFSPEILKEMNKDVSFKKVKRSLELVFDVGIIPVGFFIIGYPHETLSTLETNYKIAKKLKILRYRFGVFYPYKGSSTREKISSTDWLIPEENSYDIASNENQVLKCNVPDGKLVEYFRRMNTLIYNEPEFLLNLERFHSQHVDMQATIDNWKYLINKIQKDFFYDWTFKSKNRG